MKKKKPIGEMTPKEFEEFQKRLARRVYEYWEKQMKEIAPMIQGLEPAPKPKLKKSKHKKRFVEDAESQS